MAETKKVFNLGVVGLGHWGPNHVRVFSQLERSRVTWACDLDRGRAKMISSAPGAPRFTTDLDELLADPELDALVVCTPTASHAQVVRKALAAGKDVLCEKPLTAKLGEAGPLIKLAERNGRVLMVGHIFLFHSGVLALRELMKSGALGKLHYLHATRTNLGPFRYDVGAVLDLASHDISIFNWLLGCAPLSVNAVGRSALQQQIEDFAFVTLHYPEGVLAHIHASWLNPRKVREITLVGDKQMAVFDDLGSYGPLALYNKSVERQSYSNFGEFHLLAREGDLQFPKVQMREPLKAQAEAFLTALGERKVAVSDGRFSLGVMATLDAVARSMKRNGARVTLKEI